MAKFYVIRHGETYWNVQRRMQGQVNIPLNERGREQAIKARELLRDIPFDICYSSPLKRSLETARLVLADRKVPIVVEPLLIEQSYGISEGLRVDTILDNPEHPAYGYDLDPCRYQGDIGSEGFEELFERMRALLDEVLMPASLEHESVLVSTHGAVACALLDLILGYPLKRFWDTKLENCGVAVIEIADGKVGVTDAPSVNGRERVAVW